MSKITKSARDKPCIRCGKAGFPETAIRTFKRRLKNEVVKTDNGCWEWQGALAGAGYGYVSVRKPERKNYYAHRLSYWLHIGPIPDGHNILHRCDNPRCCNPKHLFSGTRADNTRDMVKKGRHPEHMKHHPGRRLNANQVRWVRQSDLTHRKMAEILGCHPSVIGLIRQRKTYKEVA